ncbi:MAG TPA: hypothetical protein VM432_12635 [Bdellovibrionales bacterium]|nr:hypothetical protein [Bdellovibrionales bacterium]
MLGRASVIFLALFWTVGAFAHGEDKLGPHGGFIKMPGGFHTEVISLGKSALKIYLLDISWKNPTVSKSSLNVTHQGVRAKCLSKDNHYVCEFGSKTDLTKPGQITVEAMREGQQGSTMAYDLPLSLQGAAGDHKGH